MRVLVTGTAGFIGNSLAVKLLDRGDDVVGIDIINDYYDPALKEARLNRIKHHRAFTEARIALESKESVEEVFQEFRPDYVVHLAAQVGVRHGFENPNNGIRLPIQHWRKDPIWEKARVKNHRPHRFPGTPQQPRYLL